MDIGSVYTYFLLVIEMENYIAKDKIPLIIVVEDKLWRKLDLEKR